ncbi:MAG: type II toxin-antitoxin system VapC family toxin [Fimbriimonas sp.]|nr:type II toxin-antitoxin system VapC family toxin [Fimbriimonas sp.]
MTILLDTNVLLWAAIGDDRLGGKAVELLCEPSNELFFSVASLWEIVIKSRLGRNDFRVDPGNLRKQLAGNGYSELAISCSHVLAVSELPPIHKDPFDRILIAQARVEGFSLLSSDPIVVSYPGSIVKI